MTKLVSKHHVQGIIIKISYFLEQYLFKLWLKKHFLIIVQFATTLTPTKKRRKR
uniref:Uncharacterized protein n=1 Tax=Rhizophora mucronata TaxID=61149 RepID=A0A2P2NRK0_RHIMU